MAQPEGKLYVITGDVVNSRELRKSGVEFRDCLKCGWEEILRSMDISAKAPFEFQAGDSFQVALGNLRHTTKSAIVLFAYFKAMQISKDETGLRISIGIGKGRINNGTVRESDGVAFENSGLILGTMKGKHECFKVSVVNNRQEPDNRPFHYACSFLEKILKGWSPLQARRIYKYLLGKNVTSISNEEKVKPASVSQSLKLGAVSLIEGFPDHIQDLYDMYEGRKLER